ncbi:MAG: hypothetical protein ABIH39_04700 [Candidatus Margulisiibacteriota bacterium]
MKLKARRQLSVIVISLLFGLIFFKTAQLIQGKYTGTIPDKMPLTLKERLLEFIPEDEIAFDQSDPDKLVLLWKDLNIRLGRSKTYDQEVMILKTLFPIIQNRYNQIEYVDVRFPENVVIKYLD